MSRSVFTDTTTYENIANVIREKTKTTASISPSAMPDKIRSIETLPDPIVPYSNSVINIQNKSEQDIKNIIPRYNTNNIVIYSESGIDISKESFIINGTSEQLGQVLYLESTGTQYINTGLRGFIGLDIDYQVVTKTDDLLGSRQDSINTRFGITQYGGNFHFMVGGDSILNRTWDYNRHQLCVRPTTYVYDGTTYNWNYSGKNYGNLDFYIFAMNNVSSSRVSYAKTKIWSFKAYNVDGELLLDLVPQLDSNNIPYMLDKVSGSAYVNSGSGNFNYGYTQSIEEIIPIGNEITVSNSLIDIEYLDFQWQIEGTNGWEDIIGETSQSLYVEEEYENKKIRCKIVGKAPYIGTIYTSSYNVRKKDISYDTVNVDNITTYGEPYLYTNCQSVINTGYTHKSNTKIKFDGVITNNTGSSYRTLFGARRSSYSNACMTLFVRFSGTSVLNYSRTGNETNGQAPYFGDRVNIDAYGQRCTCTRVNDGASFSFTSSGSANDGANSMFIFGNNTGGAGGASIDCYCQAKAYSFKFYEVSNDEEVLVRDFIPMKNANNVGYMHDNVSGVDYYSMTNTGFTYGEDETSCIGLGSTVSIDVSDYNPEYIDIQWQYSDDDTTFIDISGETSDTFTVSNEYLDKYIRCKITGKGLYSGETSTNSYIVK